MDGSGLADSGQRGAKSIPKKIAETASNNLKGDLKQTNNSPKISNSLNDTVIFPPMTLAG